MQSAVERETGRKRYDGTMETVSVELELLEDGTARIAAFGELDAFAALTLHHGELVRLRDFLNANVTG